MPTAREWFKLHASRSSRAHPNGIARATVVSRPHHPAHPMSKQRILATLAIAAIALVSVSASAQRARGVEPTSAPTLTDDAEGSGEVLEREDPGPGIPEIDSTQSASEGNEDDIRGYGTGGNE